MKNFYYVLFFAFFSFATRTTQVSSTLFNAGITLSSLLLQNIIKDKHQEELTSKYTSNPKTITSIKQVDKKEDIEEKQLNQINITKIKSLDEPAAFFKKNFSEACIRILGIGILNFYLNDKFPVSCNFIINGAFYCYYTSFYKKHIENESGKYEFYQNINTQVETLNQNILSLNAESQSLEENSKLLKKIITNLIRNNK